MVDEAEVARQAGERTADCAAGAPHPQTGAGAAETVAGLAARVLLAAISRNAWTFVGSGAFSTRPGRPCVLEIRDNPLCRGLPLRVALVAGWAGGRAGTQAVSAASGKPSAAASFFSVAVVPARLPPSIWQM